MKSKEDAIDEWDEQDEEYQKLIAVEKANRKQNTPPLEISVLGIAMLCKATTRIMEELGEKYPSKLAESKTKTPFMNEFLYQEMAAILACHEMGLDERLHYPIYLLGHWWNDFECWADDILNPETTTTEDK
jgi:hypothetical protein